MPEMPHIPGSFNETQRQQPKSHSRNLSSSYATINANALPYPTDDVIPGPETPYSPSGERLEGSSGFGSWWPHSDVDDDLAYGSASFDDYAPRSPYRTSINQNDFSAEPRYPPQAPKPSGSDYASTGQYKNHQPEPYKYPTMENSRYAAPPLQQSAVYPSQQSTTYQSQPMPYRTASGDQAELANIRPATRQRASSNLVPSMNLLSVSGQLAPGEKPPASPLLEAYRGTYQSISPMVSPIMIPSDDDVSDLEPISTSTKESKSHKRSSSKNEKSSPSTYKDDRPSSSKEKKRVVLYDAASDARKLAEALSHNKARTTPISDILPGLTHDQILELRAEYRKRVQMGGKGISLPKHLALKLSGDFGKAAHTTAQGRFESEGYWASVYYQSHSTRRELLIEALMGRTNAEIRAIKDGFRDKRYGDDLRKCMERELKADKFRTAVLMVLDGNRQEETDVYPPESKVRDAEVLRRCVQSREGGESAMLQIVVGRSDAHLREVLAAYERLTGGNFARDALRKSGNLVVSHFLFPSEPIDLIWALIIHREKSRLTS